MNVVYFFSPIPGKEKPAAADYFRQLNISHRSFRTSGTSIFLYTTADLLDFGITLPSYLNVVQMDNSTPMEPHFSRVRSWSEYIQSDHFTSDTIFIDADLVSRGRAHEQMFKGISSAVGLCAAPSPKTSSWINAGLIWINAERRDAVVKAFSEVGELAAKLRNSVDPRFPDKPSGVWGLDELVLTAWASKAIPQFDMKLVQNIARGEAKTVSPELVLLGRHYNFDPKAASTDYRQLSRAFVHFVGHQKDQLFEDYEPLIESASCEVANAISCLKLGNTDRALAIMLDLEQVYPQRFLLLFLACLIFFKRGDDSEVSNRLPLLASMSCSPAEWDAVCSMAETQGCSALANKILSLREH